MSETFWTAFSSIATLAGVLVALFLPYFIKKQEYKNMEKLIKLELKDNISIFKNLEEFNKVKKIGKVTINTTDRNILYLKILKLNIWNEYKYKASIHNTDVYKKYHDINTQIEAIINLLSKDKIDLFNLQSECLSVKQTIEEKNFRKLLKG